jgi:adenylyltransferase/sulfurtransferase
MNTERYQRQIVLPDIGVSGQEKLISAKVLVVGAGGLGVPVLQYLVSMGVGHIGLIDDDVVSLSNLQRQVLYRTEDIGKAKVSVAKQSLKLLNPEVAISTYRDKLTKENAQQIIGAYDLVVDCTDNLLVRYIIDDVCVAQQKPFIYGALYKHEGQVSVFNYLGTPGYRNLFPDDQAKVDNCAEIGVLGVLPGIIGCYQAMEVVKVITGVGESLAGKLLVINAATAEHYTITLAPQNEVSKESLSDFQPTDEWLTWEELDKINKDQYEWVDIRLKNQYEAGHDYRFKNVPFSQIFSFEPSREKLILVCERGMTTQQATTILQAEYPDLQVYQVKGGYSSQ